MTDMQNNKAIEYEFKTKVIIPKNEFHNFKKIYTIIKLNSNKISNFFLKKN